MTNPEILPNPQEAAVATSSRTGVIYVGRTEGEHVMVLGKVGMVESPEGLENRVQSYRVADRIWSFVPEAAFAVDLPETTTIEKVEGYIHGVLEGEGLFRIRENFQAPDCNMTFLARRVQAALDQLDYDYRPIDIDMLQRRARELNSETWEKVRKGLKKGKKKAPCIYQDWLYEHCRLEQTTQELARPRDYVRQIMATGYLLRDLAAGSGIDSIEVPLIRRGELRVFPTTLPQALFEARSEADLALASVNSYTVHPSNEDQIPEQSMAMRMLLGQNLERLEVAGAFVVAGKAPITTAQISPDHLAALGHLGGAYDEHCLYEGLGVRAKLPLELYEIVRGRPHLLPGIRFWQGVQHVREQGFRIQDFELPTSTLPLWERAFEAAEELDRLGRPVPETVLRWVSRVWLPTAVSNVAA